ncbi:MerR family transcriptional regulator [Sulfurimonas sp.]|uniref:MerR family transcriptional regulator n=1 Tax=Sulfurimonas sp. TaxID=2022749 RepID=UPI0026067480|nr:MerR family transcriptional regulator [Sulfurimonas sp.]MCW8895458.1 MerR family transcriptional regulator [Sulfurimonas sp.]
MSIKMSELVKLTDTPKSTILYYVKEGLLLEPQKPKPNLHLYDESSIEVIKFIKYLQSNFGSSISEIKAVINNGSFDFERGFEAILETLNMLMGSAHQSTYTQQFICENYKITQKKLESYLDTGLLFKRDGAFTTKELEILEILLNLEKLGIATDVTQAYVKHARELAKFEVEFSKKFLEQTQNKNEALKTLFDTTLILKPYLFNMHTLKSYQESEKI